MTYLYEILQIKLEKAVLCRVSKATGICVSQLFRIRRGRRCNLVIAEVLLDYFGYEIQKKDAQSRQIEFELDLAARFPASFIRTCNLEGINCKIGLLPHTPAVNLAEAAKHYLQVTDEHFKAAAGEMQNPMLRSDASVGAELRMEKIEADNPDGHTA